ncbi:MAG: PDZ domain-containing protein, partial [Nitrospinaceae bacterium]|nr:PDZ domain-containing protein [Nitrospinaceae bacterium]NIR55477.1 PDZ domain-containing protein [Nitrospinaceae bacterium]NIS85917.1 PDZ domain-containing protein [Nitrospinaceae bacterium]NIT82765.1 PDZ domain-containing protein [Nitrospinaceae bacterium]NIU44970.1 PDZ domain-containing protein [Nitrospinaceae bacterium]
IQSMTPELASSFHLPSHREGVLVNSVDGKAPAGMGGILRGDIIIQYDGKKVPGSKKFQQMVAETRIGKIVPIKVIRNGVEKLLHVKIGKHRS